MFRGEEKYRWIHRSLPWWQTSATAAFVAAGWHAPEIEPAWLLSLGVAWLLAEVAFWAPGPRISWDSPCGNISLGTDAAPRIDNGSASSKQVEMVNWVVKQWGEEAILDPSPMLWEAAFRLVGLVVATATLLHPDLRTDSATNIYGWPALQAWIAVALAWSAIGSLHRSWLVPESGLGETLPISGRGGIWWTLVILAGAFALSAAYIAGWLFFRVDSASFFLRAPAMVGSLLLIGAWFPSGRYLMARVVPGTIVVAGHCNGRAQSTRELRKLHIHVLRCSDAARVDTWLSEAKEER